MEPTYETKRFLASEDAPAAIDAWLNIYRPVKSMRSVAVVGDYLYVTIGYVPGAPRYDPLSHEPRKKN